MKNIPKKRTRDEYTVVLEDIRSEFRVFGEGLQQVASGLEDVKTNLEDVKTDLADVKTDLGAVKSDLGDLKNELGEVKTDLEFVKQELGLIRHNQVTRDEFKFLETRVAHLERIKK